MFSTSSRNPFLTLQLDKTSSSSESTYWVSESWGKQLSFPLISVSFVYVYRVSSKQYHHVSHDKKDLLQAILLRPSYSEKRSNRYRLVMSPTHKFDFLQCTLRGALSSLYKAQFLDL